jgi:hypothetical protein
MRHVTLMTTMWTCVEKHIGEEREKALKDHFWKDMMNHGCKVERFEDSSESAWQVISKAGQEGRQVLPPESQEKYA